MDFELYGATEIAPLNVLYEGDNNWLVTIEESAYSGRPMVRYDIFARQVDNAKEWRILSGNILVLPRMATTDADKLHPVEYFITVPVSNAQIDANGEWVQPTVFHPSDLDLPPQEEPSEEEYTPMPVYPIVEPEILTE